MEQLDNLRIEKQLCFPLYICSKEIIKKYRPILEKFDLTYTQYITMMVLWNEKEINVRELGRRLYLDSGTLTPLLKKLESKGFIKRRRSRKDERNLVILITNKGMDLKNKCQKIPLTLGKCVNLSEKEALELYQLLYKIITGLEES